MYRDEREGRAEKERRREYVGQETHGKNEGRNEGGSRKDKRKRGEG